MVLVTGNVGAEMKKVGFGVLVRDPDVIAPIGPLKEQISTNGETAIRAIVAFTGPGE